MWVPAGLVYLIAGLALFAAWMRHSERRSAAMLGCVVLLACVLSSCNASAGGQASLATTVTGGDTQRASAGCGSCHTISGISNAHGLVGPPLTGIGARMYVAGVLQNTPENIVHWIQDPKAVDNKTVMPTLGVTRQDATDIAAYLYSTK